MSVDLLAAWVRLTYARVRGEDPEPMSSAG